MNASVLWRRHLPINVDNWINNIPLIINMYDPNELDVHVHVHIPYMIVCSVYLIRLRWNELQYQLQHYF